MIQHLNEDHPDKIVLMCIKNRL
ncbi:MAG: hypothetical protein IPL09_06720 [Bacteroidetes bacterium]|nr:hypothetical protein [Bacteroidota bacterium]MBK7587338.1 hypothetical protein [Bacteroidota bacterium]MBK8329150.1 hypothetical protein [Bacteroidota bacterium]